jgi:hypothetical protein
VIFFQNTQSDILVDSTLYTKHEDLSLLVYVATWSGRSLPTFRSKLLSRSSGRDVVGFLKTLVIQLNYTASYHRPYIYRYETMYSRTHELYQFRFIGIM